MIRIGSDGHPLKEDRTSAFAYGARYEGMGMVEALGGKGFYVGETRYSCASGAG